MDHLTGPATPSPSLGRNYGGQTNTAFSNWYANDGTTWNNGTNANPDHVTPPGTKGDPAYVDLSADRAVDWDLRPGAGSALIDAGDSGRVDADGSRADIGAFGGPKAEPWL